MDSPKFILNLPDASDALRSSILNQSPHSDNVCRMNILNNMMTGHTDAFCQLNIPGKGSVDVDSLQKQGYRVDQFSNSNLIHVKWSAKLPLNLGSPLSSPSNMNWS